MEAAKLADRAENARQIRTTTAPAGPFEISFTRTQPRPLIARIVVNSRRLLVLLYVLLFAGLGTGAGVLFSDAWAKYRELKLVEADHRRKLAEAEARLAEQEQILKRLQTDPAFLEKVLRRNGYARPGEYIFRFED